jgi:hypothetical protein
MKKVWEESPTGLKVSKDYLKEKAKNKEFLGNRDISISPNTRAYQEGWERIFGKKSELPHMQRD